MRIDGKPYRTLWRTPGSAGITVIDQTKLPHRFETIEIASIEAAAQAIKTMQVRGAPLIGATAAYGLALGLARDGGDEALEQDVALLAAQRPTAVNLRWALEKVRAMVAPLPASERAAAALATADAIVEDDVATCAAIGRHGVGLIEAAARGKKPGEPVHVLTHCNAGWLACIDWGTATAPIYLAHDRGIPVHVWVDETRPRNQGASLTAYELGAHGVPHTIVVDNAGGHLMQRGLVDLCVVGTDRVTANGDVCNKIGTYLKALAAKDTGVPFHVALPHSTIDWALDDGFAIPIEERSAAEVLKMTGRTAEGEVVTVAIAAPGSPARNDAFDVTPARLVTGFVTERGLCPATPVGLTGLYPERAA
jgi:methylthioribose-1-phosphate isomerase